MEATPFDRVAEIYDETRGGEERGHAYAEQLSRSPAPDSDRPEIGVGPSADFVAARSMMCNGSP